MPPELTDDDVFGSAQQVSPEMSDADVFGAPNAAQAPSFWDSLMHGIASINLGIPQSIIHAIPQRSTDALTNQGIEGEFNPAQFPAGTVTPQTVDTSLNNFENNYQDQRKAAGFNGIDWGRLAGEIVGSVPTMVAIPGGSAKTLAGAIGQGIGTGVTAASLQPVYNAGKDYGESKMLQMGLGAATGGILSPAAFGLSRVINPNPSADVTALQNAGVTPTLGQIAGPTGAITEDKLTSIPGFGDIVSAAQRRAINQFNVATYDKALEPIGEDFTGQAGREGLGQVRDKISAAYDRILPNVSFKADQDFVHDIWGAMDSIGWAGKDTQKQFEDILRNKVAPRIDSNGQMSGPMFKQMEEELTKRIGQFGARGGDDAILGDALDDVLGAFRDNLQRNNPQYADQLAAANTAWGRYSSLRTAVAKTNNADGIFTPGGLWSALRQNDTTAGKWATAQGRGGPLQDLARSGLSVLGNHYPNSGTPGRAALGALGALGSGIAAGAVNPTAAIAGGVGLGGAASLYTPWGQSALSALLSKRTGTAAPFAADALRALSGPGQTALIGTSLAP